MPDRQAALIAGYLRTPIGRYGGALAGVRPDTLAAHVVRALVERAAVDPATIDDILLGAANQAGEDNRDVARMAGLLAGLPVEVPGQTINRLCGSGMQAVISAAHAIWGGEGECFIAGGVESMSRAPYVMLKPEAAFARGAPELADTTLGWRFSHPQLIADGHTISLGQTAENVAERRGVARDEQDALASASQQRAARAQGSGRLAAEIVPVPIPRARQEPQIVSQDEYLRPETTIEALARLRPAFAEGGSVTAGNASGINDGAAALLVATEGYVARHGLAPLARVVSSAVAGVRPDEMGLGPIPASRIALARASLTIDQIDLIEINEAFASQAIACLRDLGADWRDEARVNPNGGAIALGHPLGASGARLVGTAAIELQRSGARYALATMCIGVGQGIAVVLERA